MPTRRVIKGVLGNFLGTYVSRHSDYGGYWLFGFLVPELGELRVDLFGQGASESRSPVAVAVLSAVAKFEDQRRKAHLPREYIRAASLTIVRLPGEVAGSVNGLPCSGFNVWCQAAAVMDDGKRYEQYRVLFVAPHRPDIELRSARAALKDHHEDLVR